jgi:hypothetical protein
MVIFNSFLYVYQAGDPVISCPGKVVSAGQKHFYLETQTTYAAWIAWQNGGNGEFSMAQSK